VSRLVVFVETSSVHIHDLQLEVTSMCCHAIGHDTVLCDQSSARLHYWNTLLFVGLFTAKVTVQYVTFCMELFT